MVVGGKRQGDDGATGLDVEVSGNRELKVTEEGSEEVFGGCCFACLMYRKYLVQSVAEGDIPLALLFSDLFFRVGESEYFRETRLGSLLWIRWDRG